MKSIQLLLSLTLHMLPLISAQYQRQADDFVEQFPTPYGNAFTPLYYQQRYGMACLYYATYAVTNKYLEEGGSWEEGWFNATNWMSEKGVCEWYGVTCNENNLVVKLDLSNNNIAGTFPNEFSLVPLIEYLDISNNPTGSFDSGLFWMGQLGQLTHLDVHSTYTDHTGIPPYLGNLANLKRLDISDTYIWYDRGWDVFENLLQLEWLDIGLNYYDTSFPTEIASLPNLKYLYIHESSFTGSLDFMEQLPSEMIEIWADSNFWEPGPIPSSLFRFSNLKGLSLTGCQLTGTIPTEFGTLSSLERVSIFNNTLVDTIPTELSNMESLKLFQMEDNMLTGSMPSEVCDNFFSATHNLSALVSDCESEVQCDCCNCCEAGCRCTGIGCYDENDNLIVVERPPVVDGGGGGLFACFSGDSVVTIANGGMIRMRDLKINDEVQIGPNEYSRVYSFGHYDHTIVGEFIVLHAIGLARPLEISKDHMIFVKNRGFVPASTVNIGEKLLLAYDKNSAEVTRIETVHRKGIFAPFTESGTISVNGVISSSYVTMQSDLSILTVAGIEVVSMQWIAHSFQSPHRIFCRWNTEFCTEEKYHESSGISNWVYRPYLASKWLLKEQNVIALMILAVPIVMVAGILNLLEFVTLQSTLLVTIGFLFAYNSLRTRNKV